TCIRRNRELLCIAFHKQQPDLDALGGIVEIPVNVLEQLPQERVAGARQVLFQRAIGPDVYHRYLLANFGRNVDEWPVPVLLAFPRRLRQHHRWLSVRTKALLLESSLPLLL